MLQSLSLVEPPNSAVTSHETPDGLPKPPLHALQTLITRTSYILNAHVIETRLKRALCDLKCPKVAAYQCALAAIQNLREDDSDSIRCYFEAMFNIRDTGILVGLSSQDPHLSALLQDVKSFISSGLDIDRTKPTTLEDHLVGRPLKKSKSRITFTLQGITSEALRNQADVQQIQIQELSRDLESHKEERKERLASYVDAPMPAALDHSDLHHSLKTISQTLRETIHTHHRAEKAIRKANHNISLAIHETIAEYDSAMFHETAQVHDARVTFEGQNQALEELEEIVGKLRSEWGEIDGRRRREQEELRKREEERVNGALVIQAAWRAYQWRAQMAAQKKRKKGAKSGKKKAKK